MKTTTALLAAAAALSLASGAFAQAQPARPAGAAPAQAAFPSRPGPVVAGVCVVDNEAALANATVGAAFRNRMQALTQQVQAELQPQGTAIQTEANAINALAQGAPRTQRENALRTRAQTFQNLADQRQRELQLTQQQQLTRLTNELRPVLDQVYGQRNCGILLSRDAVVALNPAMDITAAVTAGVNARIQTITFDRATLPQQPAR
jgi:outer membrane protein